MRVVHALASVAAFVVGFAWNVGVVDAQRKRIKILDAKFIDGRDGFKYFDDTFHTHQPDYARGYRSKFRKGSLVVVLGGMDNKNIWDMSGGWRRFFQVDQSCVAWVTFRYRLRLTAGVDTGESISLVAKVDGKFLGKRLHLRTSTISLERPSPCMLTDPSSP